MANRQRVSVGVDLGGTSIRVAIYGAGMQPISDCAMPTRIAAGPQSVVDEISEAIRCLRFPQASNGTAFEVLGVGIGSPGPINLRTGVLGLLPNLPGWENFPLRDALAQATGLPVILESDANAAAIGEWKLGAGTAAGLDSMAMITLGTGVGSGLILKGEVWHGMFGMGGELGHSTIVPDGSLCGCGSRGCLEIYASASGLTRHAASVAQSTESTPALRALVDHPDVLSAKKIALLAEAGDPGAQKAFDRLGYYLGLGIANLINTLDLPMVVVGGGLASSWHLFCPEMFRTVREHSVVYRLASPNQLVSMEVDRTFIRPALLGPSAGLLGAGLLPRLAQQTAVPPNLMTEMTQ